MSCAFTSGSRGSAVLADHAAEDASSPYGCADIDDDARVVVGRVLVEALVWPMPVEVAQSIAPESRIVYVDNDPLVLLHARALLTGNPNGATDDVDSNVEDPDKILREAAQTLDFSQPIALTMLGIVGNVADYAEARSIVKRLIDACPTGSYLAISDSTNTSREIIEGQRIANQSGHPYNLRTPEEIAAYFEGLELVEPGVVSINHWRPDTDPLPPAIDGSCGVARKP